MIYPILMRRYILFTIQDRIFCDTTKWNNFKIFKRDMEHTRERERTWRHHCCQFMSIFDDNFRAVEKVKAHFKVESWINQHCKCFHCQRSNNWGHYWQPMNFILNNLFEIFLQWWVSIKERKAYMFVVSWQDTNLLIVRDYSEGLNMFRCFLLHQTWSLVDLLMSGFELWIVIGWRGSF